MRHIITRTCRPVLAWLLLGAVSCADSPGIDGFDDCEDAVCSPSADDGSTGAPADDDGDDGADDGADGQADDGADDGAGAPSTGLPCEVLDVLRRNCHECHDDPPAFGGPMSLADWEDLMVPAVSDPARAVHELVAERIVDEASPMPPGGGMADADRQILLDWIAAGAPEDPASDCGADPDDGEDDVGPEALPCEPTVEFRAHALGDVNQPFAVPAVGADDMYMCFAFNNPFPAGSQGTAWAPIIDDERVVHHIVLYSTVLPGIDEGVYPCSVMEQLANRFVAIWAPGGENLVMPEEAGLALDAGAYVMQVHYNNSAHHADAMDRSGIAMCTTDEPRKYKAGSLTLGTIGIFLPPAVENFPVLGRCGTERTLLWPEDVHVAFSAPHMHKLGRSFETTITRLDPAQGGLVEETLVDVPQFDFNSHKGYVSDPPFVIHRGDEIHTRCTYDNPNPFPVLFGEGTNDEMCLNFMLVYPIDGILEQNCGVVL